MMTGCRIDRCYSWRNTTVADRRNRSDLALTFLSASFFKRRQPHLFSILLQCQLHEGLELLIAKDRLSQLPNDASLNTFNSFANIQHHAFISSRDCVVIFIPWFHSSGNIRWNIALSLATLFLFRAYSRAVYSDLLCEKCDRLQQSRAIWRSLRSRFLQQ